jgi:DinB superfamily
VAPNGGFGKRGVGSYPSNTFVARLASILEKLARAQRRLLHTADSVPAIVWRRPPERGGWCAAELIAHLIMVERSVVGKADRVVQKAPKQFSVLKRFHLPLALVEARFIRRKTPMPPDPALVQEKEAMLAELRDVRERTLAFLEETKGRDLSKHRWPHAFLGALNVYEWFQFIASHEVRHEKQMQEIAASLPKTIATSEE